MAETANETLGELIQRVLLQKGLSLHEVERRSGKRVTSSHLSKMISGKVESISVRTIAALAKGLDIDPFEIFAAVIGSPAQDTQISPALLIDVLHKVAENPELVRVVRNWSNIPVPARTALLKQMERLRRPGSEGGSNEKKS
jgi:transcriptional regulator with XRE-family HTH domain